MKKILRLVCIASFIGSIVFSVWFYGYWSHRYNHQQEILEERFENSYKAISDELTSLAKEHEHLTASLPNLIKEHHLDLAIKRNPHLVGAIYLDKNESANICCEYEKKLEIDPIMIRNYKGRTGWLDTSFQRREYRIFGFYSSEVKDQRGKPTGYLIGIYELPVTAQKLNELIYTFSSYAEIVDGTGNVVAHPFVFTNVAKEELKELSAQPQYIQPLPESNDWRLLFHLQKKDILPVSKKIWLLQLMLKLTWSTSLILLLAVLVKAHEGSTSSLAIVSGAVVLNFILISSFILASFANSYSYSHENADDYKYIYHKVAKLRDEMVLVPTSFRVENISLIDNSSYVISGLMAQIYPNNTDVTVGVLFPDEIKAPLTKFELISKINKGTYSVYTWQFSVELGKLFTQRYFPLDRNVLEMVLWPKDLTGKVFFIPDMIALQDLRPHSLPGVDETVRINNWTIDQSFFGMSDRTFAYFKKSNLPFSTNFKIVIQRTLVNAFISNLMPLFIAMLLTFALVCMPIKKLESPTLPSISIVIAIIFVVTVNQSGLRRNLGIHSFAYIEFLYSLYYIQLLLLTMNFIVYTTRQKPLYVIGYRDNLVPKLMYWPLLTGTFTLVLISGFS